MAQEILNTKHEILNKFEIRNSNVLKKTKFFSFEFWI